MEQEQQSQLRHLIICQKCHTLHEKCDISNGESALCSSCGRIMYSHDESMLDKAIALGLTGLLLFVMANAFPLVSIDVLGQDGYITMISMLNTMFDKGFYIVAMSVAFLIFIFPLMSITIYILLAFLMKYKIGKNTTKSLLILLSKVLPWSMIEIYLVSILVALVKLLSHFQIHIGLSFWALSLFVILDIYVSKNIRLGELWELRYRVYGKQ